MARRKTERVLVTRSEPGASTLTAALLAAGVDAVVYPVLAIRPLDARTIERAVSALPKWSAAIFLSVHAVTHGLEPLLRKVDQSPDTPVAAKHRQRNCNLDQFPLAGAMQQLL